jgi:hypothetical protein
MFVQTVPLLTCNSPAVPQSVHQTISPAAGVAIVFLCACVIRGGKNPLLVDVTSNTAEAFGLVVPIPTCALLVTAVSKKIKIIWKVYFFISFIVLNDV